MTETITREKALAVVKKYLTQKQSPNNTFNLFDIIQMRERSHSKLLAWLLDVKGKTQNSIQFMFLKNFLAKYYDTNLTNIEKIMPILCENFSVYNEYPTKDKYGKKNGDIDILVYSKEAKLLLIIENKLDAKICTRNGKTQIERYYEYITGCQNFKNIEPKFMYVCSYSEQLTEKYVKNITIHDTPVLEISISNLLDKFGYEVVEHSDIILMLNNILQSYPECYIKDMLLQYIHYWEYNEKIGYTPIIDGIYVWDACNKLGVPYNKLDLKQIQDKVLTTPQIDVLTC